MEELDDIRFTLMVFPQKVDVDGHLHLNILFVPRNFSPLEPVDTVFGEAGEAQAFADAQPVFKAMIVNNPNEFPGILENEGNGIPIDVIYSEISRTIYETLKNTTDEEGKPKYFDIDETYSTNPDQRMPKAMDASKSIKKYLPLSYQNAFNFTGPRTPNAVTDDSYACAMRHREKPKTVVENNKVSWGKVYAHLLRQPQLAEKAGLLYRNIKIPLAETDFKNGGWLYVDVADDSVYFPEQQNSLEPGKDIFIKRYAARIPQLKRKNDKFLERSLFAAVLFPVIKPDETPKGIYDELYIESSTYNDGFAKIVHANQPVSSNLLADTQDGMPPQQELGIRLGWDDEQILIWYLRQLAKDPNVDAGNNRLDAPLGVMGYHIDVQEIKVDVDEEENWESLTAVKSNGTMLLDTSSDVPINLGSYEGELPFQVYPVKVYGEEEENYWLPIYFANWNDHSMVLPDKIASELYLNQHAIQKEDIKDPDSPVKDRKVTISDTYKPLTQINHLRYGKSYKFRVRLSDNTGGGPTVDQAPSQNGVSDKAEMHFKRYVAPYALRIVNDDAIDPFNDELSFNGNNLKLKRPLIGYPAVVYTGKYDDPVALLHESIEAQLAEVDSSGEANVIVGIADPDVVSVEVKVEVETLKMDNLRSDTGRDNFIKLYTTRRKFKKDYDQELTLEFNYQDLPVIDFDLPFETYASDIQDSSGKIVIPTSRNIRLSLRPVCDGDDSYWGNTDVAAVDSRYGKPTILKMRRNSESEKNILTDLNAAKVIQALYLQPDPIIPKQGEISIKNILPEDGGLPNILQRLAQQIDVACNNDPKNLTLSAEKGERIQFWCSNLIRHTLSPDKSSITFANKNELIHKWYVATSVKINRDWSWDGLETLAFTIERKKSMKNNPTETTDRETMLESIPYQQIGDVDMRRIASFQAIQEGEDEKVHREYTRLIFIDAVDTLPATGEGPDTIAVKYRIKPLLKTGITLKDDAFETNNLLVPTTIKPSQIPKVIGSGIALSPYIKDDKYSKTEPRKRFLWLEFDQLPDDNRDALFARQVAYSPDQLISNNHPELYKVEEDVPLVLDPEYTRVITPDSGHDHSGLKAMKRMQKSSEADRHFYILPLPEGLHHESPELFGFHTYEFRFGHTEQLWSTAQGRFGRSFRLTGLQHPSPTLLCAISRIGNIITVSAPYALAVSNGKNVTASPPRTSIWCLLYAQVAQADGKAIRNILIHEGILQPLKTDVDPTTGIFIDKLNGRTQQGAITFTNNEIIHKLEAYGLPENSPLSIICVEVFGYIRNIREHITSIWYDNHIVKEVAQGIIMDVDKKGSDYMGEQQIERALKRSGEVPKDTGIPLSRDLGKYRILRTSPLTEVPATCCVDC
ncbi:hypothetical protein [Aequorivita capsosiphonis]|uniref:hypothetical protein n=1 Tax=Aequorivita capsosiphonis TaxID=487317 RepID=UPI0003F51109|nr:hypothetical protein [Aequorivita capsosiphonis]